MRNWSRRARESFWFLPTVFGVGAIVLAVGLIEVDRLLLASDLHGLPVLGDLSATGGRAILSAVGGTMLGVAATSFSITISVLATTSSAYGPRLVRNFMADRGNQVVLAVLTSTFLYSLIVLRSIRTEEDSTLAFVPVAAVGFAMLLAICDVAVLVYFIHHIAMSVQVSTLQQRVAGELDDTIELLYLDPSEGGAESGADADTADPDAAWAASGSGLPVSHFSPASGRVLGVDLARLVASGRRTGRVYRVRAHPGAFVLEGDVLLESRPDGTASDSTGETRRTDPVAAFSIGSARTPHQDVTFAVQQLVEMGVRGLASGTNDPYTAVSAIDALSVPLVRLAARRARSTYRDPDGVVRVICDWPHPSQLIADVYLALRTYAVGQPLVIEAACRLTARLETVVTGPLRPVLREQTAALAAADAASGSPSLDSLPLEREFARLDALLAVGHTAQSAPESSPRRRV